MWLISMNSSSLNSPIFKNYKKYYTGIVVKQCQLECGPMPNLMVALQNIGGALCSTPQSLATRVPCSNAAKTRKPLKFAGVPQTHQQISAVRRPKFTILWRHVWELGIDVSKFFPIVDTCLSCEDTARQSCAMVPKWRFFASCIFSEQRTAHFRHAF